MPDHTSLILALFIAGFVLIAAEVFLPGLILGALGFVCLVTTVVLVFVNYGTLAGLIASFVVGSLTLVGFISWLYLFPRTFIGRRIVLKTPASSDSVDADNQSLVGRTGEALTPLRPTGTARIDGRRVDVMAIGDFLDEGSIVEVVSADGLRVVVRRKVVLQSAKQV
jgi:membrane-bound serine protease (ClpP class)